MAGARVELVRLWEGHDAALTGHRDGGDVAWPAHRSRSAVTIGVEHGEEALEGLAAHHRLERVEAGGDRHDGLDPTVVGAGVDGVDPADRDAPGAYSLSVDLRLGAEPGDRVSNILLLVVWVEVVPRLALAGTEAPVVEGQSGIAGGREPLGVAGQRDIPHGADGIGHHDGGGTLARSEAVRQVQPRRARCPLAGECDLPAHR